MRAVTRIDGGKLDAMPLEIKLTATVSEWREMMRQMPAQWPSCELGRAIAVCLGHITRSTEATFTDPKHMAEED